MLYEPFVVRVLVSAHLDEGFFVCHPLVGEHEDHRNGREKYVEEEPEGWQEEKVDRKTVKSGSKSMVKSIEKPDKN